MLTAARLALFNPSLENCLAVPNSRWLLAFHYAVKLALDLVEAAEDQQETVIGAQGTHRKVEALAIISG